MREPCHSIRFDDVTRSRMNAAFQARLLSRDNEGKGRALEGAVHELRQHRTLSANELPRLSPGELTWNKT